MNSQDGRTNVFAQKLATYQYDSYGRGSVYAVRKATLTEDMSAIESRRLLHLAVVDMDGYEKESVREMSWTKAQELRDSLTAALDATSEQYWQEKNAND